MKDNRKVTLTAAQQATLAALGHKIIGAPIIVPESMQREIEQALAARGESLDYPHGHAKHTCSDNCRTWLAGGN